MKDDSPKTENNYRPVWVIPKEAGWKCFKDFDLQQFDKHYKLVLMNSRCCISDLNDCSNTTCSNGGSCVDLVDDYFCNCTVGWTGEQCKTS